MRKIKIFSGSSHPQLTASICERLGISPSKCDLTKFSNGETSVSILTSIRDQDVFIIQSGSKRMNDSVMELLIMISACKGGSARSITAVMPYFPYSRQSKKKSHRGAITAKMLANLLSVAGVTHVMTCDLHAAQMQGFFATPVDNLFAEPLIARWIRNNVREWKEAVVVSKNPGGSKRVTSLADTLKLNFAIITTDRRRSPLWSSTSFDTSAVFGTPMHDDTAELQAKLTKLKTRDVNDHISNMEEEKVKSFKPISQATRTSQSTTSIHRHMNESFMPPVGSSLIYSTSFSQDSSLPTVPLQRAQTVPASLPTVDLEHSPDEYTDERAREVITGRLYQGHIVDDDFPSPLLSTLSGSVMNLAGDLIGPPQLDERDPMASSFLSTASSFPTESGVNGRFRSADCSDKEEEEELNDPAFEHTVTLVGNVNDRTVLIIDDMMDRCESWIAAAETVKKRGGATKVYCIATHGLFGEDSLESMQACDCIDFIVVTNTFPIDPERIRSAKKLTILDMSGMLAEAIRRNHYGECMQQLYQHYQD